MFSGKPFYRASLHVLSLVISYLDAAQRSQRHGSYIFPAVYRSSCLYGKPYHFWLAAYMSKYGYEQKFGKLRSFSLPVFLGAMYEIIADYNGREYSKIFLEGKYSVANNARRLDASMKILGAYYGIQHSTLEIPNNIDSLVLRSFNTAKKPKRKGNTSTQAENVLAWLQSTQALRLMANLWRLQ